MYTRTYTVTYIQPYHIHTYKSTLSSVFMMRWNQMDMVTGPHDDDDADARKPFPRTFRGFWKECSWGDLSLLKRNHLCIHRCVCVYTRVYIYMLKHEVFVSWCATSHLGTCMYVSTAWRSRATSLSFPRASHQASNFTSCPKYACTYACTLSMCVHIICSEW